MKFDVIVGNPPYQDSVKGYKGLATLWPKISKSSIERLKKNGKIAFITPYSWMSPGSDLLPVFRSKKVEYVNLDCGKFFTVGSTFSYWILENSDPVGKTIMDGGGHTVLLNLTDTPFVPNSLSPETFGILDKTVFADIPKFDMNINSECHSQNVDNVSDTQGNGFDYPVRHTNSAIKYSKKRHSNFFDKKVLFPVTGNLNPVYDPGTIGTGQNTCWISIAGQSEADILIWFMQKSKLFVYINKVCKWSGANNRELLRRIPMIDLSRAWTDKELYDHFGLTEEEIDYIEATIN